MMPDHALFFLELVVGVEKPKTVLIEAVTSSLPQGSRPHQTAASYSIQPEFPQSRRAARKEGNGRGGQMEVLLSVPQTSRTEYMIEHNARKPALSPRVHAWKDAPLLPTPGITEKERLMGNNERRVNNSEVGRQQKEVRSAQI